MTEALGVIIDYGFGELELNRVEAVVMPGNTASVKLLGRSMFWGGLPLPSATLARL